MKADLALILGAINTVCVVLLAVWQGRAKKKASRLYAYEAVYEDACFVLTYPFRCRSEAARATQYKNDDPELEEAVRSYLDAHWMKRMWPGKSFAPGKLNTDEERREFRKRVSEEAEAFDRDLFRLQIELSLPERSPVYHLEDDQVNARLTSVLHYVGAHLSLFSSSIRDHWEKAKFLDPQETKNEYERGLGVCPHFFEHNARDFDDPFIDLLEAIRQEYRKMTRRRIDPSSWTITWSLRRITGRLRHWLSSVRHPALSFRVWRRLRRAMRDSLQDR
jgi:hypothetical protein